MLETELLELLADENNLTPTEYKPGEDEPFSTKTENSSADVLTNDPTNALADKLQEQVNITYVQTDYNKEEEQKKKEIEGGKTNLVMMFGNYKLHFTPILSFMLQFDLLYVYDLFNLKEMIQKRRRIHLPAVKWAIVYRALKPLLRPCGDLGEGRLDFYHRSISKAVRRK